MIGSDISAVDVFCGAAGLSLGLRASGISIAAGIDIDPACRYPFEENIKARFIEADVTDLPSSHLANLFRSAKFRLLAGCAPCQPFSGYTTKRREIDTRWQLLIEFLRIVEEIRPEFVTVENVPRLSHLPLWDQFVRKLKKIGYYVSWNILDAADYGVPQNRRRLVLLASALGSIELPEPCGDRQRTVRWAIGMQPPIEAGMSNPTDPLHASRALTQPNLLRIRTSKAGGTWRDWPDELRAECHRSERGRTYPSVYGRMSWDKPSPTMTTQFYGFGNGRFGHPEQDRAISLREGALLQSFPPDFRFAPMETRVNFRAMGRLIGNAVPPKLGEAIGRSIVEHANYVSI